MRFYDHPGYIVILLVVTHNPLSMNCNVDVTNYYRYHVSVAVSPQPYCVNGTGTTCRYPDMGMYCTLLLYTDSMLEVYTDGTLKVYNVNIIMTKQDIL